MYTHLICPGCGELVPVLKKQSWEYLSDSSEYICSKCQGHWHVFAVAGRRPFIINIKENSSDKNLDEWIKEQFQEYLRS